MRRFPLRFVLLPLLVWPWIASAQVYVYPRRADKSLVRYDDFRWLHVDILVGPEADRIEGQSVPAWPGGMRPPQGTPEGSDRPQGETLQRSTWEPRPEASLERGALGQPPSGHGFSPGGSVWMQALRALPSHALLAQSHPELDAEPSPGSAVDGGVTTGGDAGVQEGEGNARPLEGGGMVPGLITFAGADGGAWERELGPHAGGVRLYFYERERQVTERAVPLITHAYRYLVEEFNYVPSRTFPYVLYSTYQEFLQTNLFPLSEGTLGVTSPIDLKLTLPYFGDPQFFDLVSTHELSHQFTIQKVKTAAEKANSGNPLDAMPLWFIEGLAEYYAQRGLDPEAELLIRDLLVNPQFEHGYVLQDFFAEGPYGFLWIYKMGQARCAFLEETYGKGTLQKLLEQSPLLVGASGPGQVAMRIAGGFPGLLHRVTGDEPRIISVKFEAWLKHRGFTTYLHSTGSQAELEPLENVDGFPSALASGPDGNLVAFRSTEPETGMSQLFLVDRRAPGSRVRVANDGVPGVESLHPVFGRNFALAEGRLVFIAEAQGRDVLYLQKFHRKAELLAPPLPGGMDLPAGDAPGGGASPVGSPAGEPPPSETAVPDSHRLKDARLLPDGGVGPLPPQWEVDLDLEDRTAFRLADHGVVAAYSPAFSPDGKRVALIGLDSDGIRDVFVVDLDQGPQAPLLRLTHDVYAERQLTWGPQGIVYTSDATSHSKQNLFQIAAEPGAESVRLTTEARDHQDPLVLPNGQIFFVAFADGRSNVYALEGEKLIRRTDFSSGLFELGPGPEGGLWALEHRGGMRHPVWMAKIVLSNYETLVQPPGKPPAPIPTVSLDSAQLYRPLRLSNWEMGPIFGVVGGSAGGVAGQVFASASDRLKNHSVFLQGSVFGSFKFTDGILAYLNQERRVSWGTGIFQTLRFRVDQTPLPGGGAPFMFTSGERFFGALATARYPFNQFVYVQSDFAVGGVSYYLGDAERFLLSDTNFTPDGINLFIPWEKENAGVRLQTELSVRVGYDTLRYHYATGPIDGSSVLLELTGDWQPVVQETFASIRLDAERYFPISGRTHLLFRLGIGTNWGQQYVRQYFLSSFDTLRGVEFGDPNFLLGKNYLYSTAELQVPLNALIRFILLSDVEGIAALDAGGVGNTTDMMWQRRVVDGVLGFNFALGPILFRLHFAKPFLIGEGALSPTPNQDWVTNFSIGIAGLGGFFGKQQQAWRGFGPPPRVP